eukprot:6484642-Amphidinium_carterae.2
MHKYRLTSKKGEGTFSEVQGREMQHRAYTAMQLKSCSCAENAERPDWVTRLFSFDPRGA